MTPPLVTFQQVSFRYPGRQNRVLEDLDLSFQPGEITAILGPNGAGKTTLLQLILGWQQPQSGRVLLEGIPVAQYSRRELGRAMSLVPQSEHISFDFSVLDYVMLGRAPYLGPLEQPSAEDEAVAMNAIDTVGIPHLAYRAATALSGGERQLVLLARALAQQPRLLLLDEPTSHLDLGNKVLLIHLLKTLHHQGVSVIFTTHEPEVASQLAHAMVLMRAGKVVGCGGAAEVFTSVSLTALYGVQVTVEQVHSRSLAIWGETPHS